MPLGPNELIEYFKVRYWVVADVEDSADPNDLPDQTAVNGWITFTPNLDKNAPVVKYPTALDPADITDNTPLGFELAPLKRRIKVKDGMLSHNDTGYVMLEANSPYANPPVWNWHVEFDLTTAVGRVNRAGFDILAVPDTIVDLTVASPASTGDGQQIIQGPPGYRIQSVDLVDGDQLVFTLDDPATTELPPVTIPAISDANAAQVAAEAAAVAAAASQSAAAASQSAAAGSASSASTSAGTATTQAGNASTSAGAASTSAGAAAGSASSASTSAGTATTQAGIATDAASTATTQAGIATTQAGNASTSAGTATTQAGNASTSAGNASASATAANLSKLAAEAAVNSFDLDIGTVTTLAPGASATASVGGGPPAWVLDLGIPQGVPGAGSPDATTGSKGSIQLAGDLGGTGTSAAAPVITNLAITAAKIANDTITANQIANNAITANELADNAVDTAAIAADAVTTVKILNANVTLAKLATDSVDSSKIVNDSIVNADINSSAAIAGSKLANGAIGPTQLATDAVETAKILNANVTLAKLAANSVDSSKIVDDSIVNADINSAAAIALPKLGGKPGTFAMCIQGGTRAVNAYGDLLVGMYVMQPFIVDSITYQFGTADTGGGSNWTGNMKKNGSAALTSGQAGVTAANQADGTGTDAARTFVPTSNNSFAKGDRIGFETLTVGTTPGKILTVIIEARFL